MKIQISLRQIMLSVLSIFLTSICIANDIYYKQVILDSEYVINGVRKVEGRGSINCYKFSYDNEGRLISVTYPGKKGKLERDPYFEVANIQIEYNDNFEKRTYLNAHGKPMKDKISGVYAVRIKYDQKGIPISIYNYDKDGRLTKDKYGVAQYMKSTDENGKKTVSIRLNEQGDRVTDKEGFYELRAEYDGAGKIIRQISYNKKGGPVQSDNRIREVKYAYDNYGNLKEVSYWGSDQQRMENEFMGMSIFRSEYDKDGNLKEISFYGTDELLIEVHDRGKLFFAKIKLFYDRQGTLQKTLYFDKNDEVINPTKQLM